MKLLKNRLQWIVLLPLAFCSCDSGVRTYQATGFKVGEVDTHSAVVWTRLTLRKERNPSDGPMVGIEYVQGEEEVPRRQRVVAMVRYPEGKGVGDLRDAVPGTQGEVRVLYRPEGTLDWSETSWQPVDPDRDFTRQFLLNGLEAATRYELRVESRPDPSGQGDFREGRFRTAPPPDRPARVVFTVSTGQRYPHQDRPDGYNIYPEMRKLDPDFFVHTGDIVYYDELAKTPELARYHWQRTYSLPTNVDFHQQVASYFIKDDHDTWQNDSWPSMQSSYMFEFTWAQGVKIFPEQVPMRERTYRTYRWGKDLQVWLVEGRDFRSANDAPDGPEKTIWGDEQKNWFKTTVQESDATFRLLISPTPVVGPDRDNKRDNHSNRNFAYEGRELRDFLSSQSNMAVVCGDRHWQYASVDPETGLREYSCGPASDVHAGGWRQEDFRETHHRYLNVVGGFLSVTVEREEEEPRLTFRFHDVRGGVLFEDTLPAR